MRVGRRYEFSLAHRLPSHRGKCRRMHGHNYILELEVEGEIGVEAVVLWYEDIDVVAKAWIDAIDHYTVLAPDDDCADGAGVVRCPMGEPSAENLAAWAWRDISARLPDGVRVGSLKLWETERAWVSMP